MAPAASVLPLDFVVVDEAEVEDVAFGFDGVGAGAGASVAGAAVSVVAAALLTPPCFEQAPLPPLDIAPSMHVTLAAASACTTNGETRKVEMRTNVNSCFMMRSLSLVSTKHTPLFLHQQYQRQYTCFGIKIRLE